MFRRFRLGILLIIALVALALVAWEPSITESPYTGTYSREYVSSDVVISKARQVKWNTAGISRIRANFWDEFFDQTADCTVNSPNGDKLIPLSYSSNIPNWGVWAYNDCGGPLPDVNEEVELHQNSLATVAEQAYYYDIRWRCNGAVSGEINTTYELGAIGAKDWLDKVTYSRTTGVCGAASSSLSGELTNQSAFQPSTEGKDSPPIPQETPLLSGDGPEELYQYRVVETPHGKIRIRVHVNFHDPLVFERYRALNSRLAESLMGTHEPVRVTMTFVSPHPVNAVAALLARSELTVLSYGATGRDELGDQVSVFIWPESAAVEPFPPLEGVTLDGIMVVTGLVKPTSDGLGLLTRDPRIALLDVLATVLKQDVEAELGKPIDVLQIHIPTPFWDIAATAK